jgi:hypothetical protein
VFRNPLLPVRERIETIPHRLPFGEIAFAPFPYGFVTTSMR